MSNLDVLLITPPSGCLSILDDYAAIKTPVLVF